MAWLGEDDLSTSFLRLMVRIYQHLQQRYSDTFDAEAQEDIFGKETEIARAKLAHLLVERFLTRAAARAATFEYINVYYNRTRLHSRLGYLSPDAFEAKHSLS